MTRSVRSGALGFLLAGLCTCARTESRPALTWDSSSDIDLGCIACDQPVPLAWVLRNSSDVPVRISSTSTSCACLHLESVTDRPLEPGESLPLSGRLMLGPGSEIDAAISVRYEGRTRGAVEAWIHAQCVSPLRLGVEPREIAVPRDGWRPGSEATFGITLTGTGALESPTITASSPRGDRLASRIEWSAGTQPASRGCEQSRKGRLVIALPPEATWESGRSLVLRAAADDAVAEARIHCTVMRTTSDYVVTPSVAYLGSVRVGGRVDAAYRISRRDRLPFAILPDRPPENTHLLQEPASGGLATEHVIRLNVGAPASGPLAGALRVRVRAEGVDQEESLLLSFAGIAESQLQERRGR